MSKTLEIEGIKFYPLTLVQMQELEEELKILTGGNKRIEGESYFSKDRIDKMLKIYAASAQRGVPSITEAQIGKIIDIENVVEINKAVLGQLGKDLSSASTNAESAAVPTSPLIGGVSTQG